MFGAVLVVLPYLVIGMMEYVHGSESERLAQDAQAPECTGVVGRGAARILSGSRSRVGAAVTR